jgi:hypothetical protein
MAVPPLSADPFGRLRTGFAAPSNRSDEPEKIASRDPKLVNLLQDAGEAFALGFK